MNPKTGMNHREHKGHRVEAGENRDLVNILKELWFTSRQAAFLFVNSSLCALCGKSAFSLG